MKTRTTASGWALKSDTIFCTNTNIYAQFPDRTPSHAPFLPYSRSLSYVIANRSHRSCYTLATMSASIHRSCCALKTVIASVFCEGRDHHGHAHTYCRSHQHKPYVSCLCRSSLNTHLALSYSFFRYVYTTNFSFTRLSLWLLHCSREAESHHRAPAAQCQRMYTRSRQSCRVTLLSEISLN